MKTRVMQEKDIPAVLSLRNWSIDREQFKLYSLFFPGESFVAEETARIIAHASTVNYRQTAWLGRIFLAERDRGKGKGRKFIEDILGVLEARGVRSVYLESLEGKVDFFSRLGFEKIGRTISLKGRTKGTDVTGRGAVSNELFEKIRVFDREHFKADRSNVLRLYLESCPQFAIVKKSAAGEVEGYIMARRSPLGYTIGPCLATGDSAEPLFAEEISLLPSGFDVRVKVPADNSDAIRILCGLSFADEKAPTVRMRYGEKIDIADSPSICALGSHAGG